MNILILIMLVISIILSIICIFIALKGKNMQVNIDNTEVINTLLSSMKNTEIGMQNSIHGVSLFQRNESDIMQKKIDDLVQKNESKIEKLTFDVNTNMRLIREENEKKLELMRETVDEKLNSSLATRLNESFSKIKASLDSVDSGLGEMRALAGGVGDLKRMLSNVKARGVWGEVMLNSLLEQALANNQYGEQVQVKPNSQERVDFAVFLPGKDEQNIILPIDSKFPIEDYYKLSDATEKANIDDIEKAQKALFKRIKDEAKKIKEKYIFPPVTTDFAVMFLPLESLYLEVVKNTELIDLLQNSYKVMVCGPTNLMAFLNSLQMGFKTLYIEKRSSEIWSMLNVFRTEFEKFDGLLQKTQKKISEANDNIELATKSTSRINKQLGNVKLQLPNEGNGSTD